MTDKFSTFHPFGSISIYSIHIRSHLFYERCVTRRHHGVALAHGCSPRYTLYRVYQVNVRVGCIAWQQATIGGFAPEATHSPLFVDSDSDDDDGDDDDASEDYDNGDASSTDEMSTWHSYPLLLVTARGSSFHMRVVILRRRVSIGHFIRGSVDMRDEWGLLVSLFSFFYRYIVLVL